MSVELARELLRDGFDRVAATVRTLTSTIDPDVLLYRPDPESNHVAWLLWHLSRIQDDHLAGLAEVLGGAEIPASASAQHVPSGQLWLEDGWTQRFALPYPETDTGFGHSADEVGAFTASDSALLAAYHQAVHERTLEVVESLSPEDLSRVVDWRWDPAVAASSRIISVLNETAQHAGQAAYVHGLALRALR